MAWASEYATATARASASAMEWDWGYASATVCVWAWARESGCALAWAKAWATAKVWMGAGTGAGAGAGGWVGAGARCVVQPVQGRGVTRPPDVSLAGAQRLCREAGALFVCDEVQTGLGRTGRFLAGEHWDLEPDLICLSKALSGGLVPIGAVLVSRAAFDRVFDGMERAVRHGSPFGGNGLMS